MRITRVLNTFGIIAPIWLAVGVSICAALYPGYSHVHQAMSELHAIGSPVATITPLINHYPLTLLFVGFGIAVYQNFDSKLTKLAATMIMLHGAATFIAGYFQCDIGCAPESTLLSQTIHNLAGLILFLSLLIAPAIWVFQAKKQLGQTWFKWISVACITFQILALPFMATALESGSNFGLYQRMAYGAALLWLIVFSYILCTDTPET